MNRTISGLGTVLGLFYGRAANFEKGYSGEFSKEAIDHYLYELDALKRRGIKVCLTLVHFVLPLWFEEKGGMNTPENLSYFERYLAKVVPIFAPYVDMWTVLNEFNCGTSIEACKNKMSVIRYHALGYHFIKMHSKAPVSTAHAMILFEPYRKYDTFDNAAASLKDCYVNEFFFHAIRTGEVVFPFLEGYFDTEIRNTCDFWAINIYTRSMVDAGRDDAKTFPYHHKDIKMLPMEGFYHREMYPETIIHQLSRLKDLPVHITENGCSCYDDDFRIVYLTLYLNAIHEAIESGIDVRSYMHWSLLDNYEWGTFAPRFGLVDVNFKTFERKIKKSGYFFRDIIENNGFSQEILRKYLDKLPLLQKYTLREE